MGRSRLPPTLSSASGLDLRDVDLDHLHHGFHHALGCGLVRAGHSLYEYARYDLPVEPKFVLAPAAGDSLSAVVDDRVPVTVRLLLSVSKYLKRYRLVKGTFGTTVQADERLTQYGELHRQNIARLAVGIVGRGLVDGGDMAVGERCGVELRRLFRIFVEPETRGHRSLGDWHIGVRLLSVEIGVQRRCVGPLQHLPAFSSDCNYPLCYILVFEKNGGADLELCMTREWKFGFASAPSRRRHTLRSHFPLPCLWRASNQASPQTFTNGALSDRTPLGQEPSVPHRLDYLSRHSSLLYSHVVGQQYHIDSFISLMCVVSTLLILEGCFSKPPPSGVHFPIAIGSHTLLPTEQHRILILGDPLLARVAEEWFRSHHYSSILMLPQISQASSDHQGMMTVAAEQNAEFVLILEREELNDGALVKPHCGSLFNIHVTVRGLSVENRKTVLLGNAHYPHCIERNDKALQNLTCQALATAWGFRPSGQLEIPSHLACTVGQVPPRN